MEELTSIRYADCPDMETYINKKVTTAQKLKGINSEVKDRLLAGLFLMELPEDFGPLVQSISSSDDNITTEAVKERLLAEAARQESHKRESALASHHKSKWNKKKSSKKQEGAKKDLKF